MHTSVISPKVLRVAPVRCPDTGRSTGTWVEFEAVLAEGDGTFTFDLLVAEVYGDVVAAIERAGKAGEVLVIFADDRDYGDGCNQVTGRRWFRGVIGPASQTQTPPVEGLILSPDTDVECCIFAPRILRAYPAAEASPYFGEANGVHDVTCLDVFAGDDQDRLVHLVVPMTPSEARGFIENARIIRRPLVLWFRQHLPGCVHVITGKPVLIGSLDRLGSRGPAALD